MIPRHGRSRSLAREVARLRAPVARAEGARSFGGLGWPGIDFGEAARESAFASQGGRGPRVTDIWTAMASAGRLPDIWTGVAVSLSVSSLGVGREVAVRLSRNAWTGLAPEVVSENRHRLRRMVGYRAMPARVACLRWNSNGTRGLLFLLCSPRGWYGY